MPQNDALDRILSAGSSMDGFTPLLSMTGGALGWWRHFIVPRAVYADVHALLQQKRLPMRNVMIVDDVVCFDIDAGSAPLVALLLRQQFGIEFSRPPRWLTHRRSRRRRTRR
jgi:hypothetical protein